MCVMEDVGVRELRQNLSVYLRRVAQGHVLRVTERGRPVALLGPLAERRTAYERLVDDGRLIPPRHLIDRLGPPLRRPGHRPLGDALDEQRGE